MKDIKKLAERGRAQLRPYDELRLGEIIQIYEIAKNPKPHHDSIWDVMDVAYHAGYAAGIRAEQAKKESGTL